MKSMNMDKMFKKLETSHILAGLALVVLVWALMNYSNDKATSNFAPISSNNNKKPSADLPLSDVSATSNGPVNGASAADLLPSDSNSSWGNVAATPGLDKVNLLQAGAHYGINTVGTSLRNANLQLRKDPPIAKKEVGPWNGSTMEPDPTGLGCT